MINAKNLHLIYWAMYLYNTLYKYAGIALFFGILSLFCKLTLLIGAHHQRPATRKPNCNKASQASPANAGARKPFTILSICAAS